ncbi:MAG: hypothetical protein KF770_16545 [Anaerolineae bacterium]|nr:hypothetical protein [Anaerolineae bacterium]
MARDPQPLRVVLFALTGFGNPVLTSCVKDSRVRVEAVFTIKYKTPLPYYDEVHLDELCEQYGITCYGGVKIASGDGLTLLNTLSPDLILVATFKQILTPDVLQIPRLGVVNFHPSLLPKYRGPCPSNAALWHGEVSTGVTAHYVTEGIDEGNILLQRSVPIDEGEIDGRLRQKLARLSGDMTPEIITMFADFHAPSGVPQDHQQATFAPKPTIEDGYLESASDIQTIERKMRAFNPLPGTSILLRQQRVEVTHYERLPGGQANGIYEHEHYIDWYKNFEAIRLFKHEDNR